MRIVAFRSMHAKCIPSNAHPVRILRQDFLKVLRKQVVLSKVRGDGMPLRVSEVGHALGVGGFFCVVVVHALGLPWRVARPLCVGAGQSGVGIGWRVS